MGTRDPEQIHSVPAKNQPGRSWDILYCRCKRERRVGDKSTCQTKIGSEGSKTTFQFDEFLNRNNQEHRDEVSAPSGHTESNIRAFTTIET